MQHLHQRLLRGRIGRPAQHIDAQATFDPADRLARTAYQFGGLAGPRRQRTQARDHEALDGAVGHGLGPFARLQDPAQGGGIGRAFSVGLDEVHLPGSADAQIGGNGLQAGFETFAAERRQGGRALEDHHVRGTVVGKRAR